MKRIETLNYKQIIEVIRLVPYNHLFALAVLKGHVFGEVYADNPDAPQTVYIRHPYGMSLLVGKAGEPAQEWLRSEVLNTESKLHGTEWLQVFPHGWNDVIGLITDLKHNGANSNGLKKKIELQTRVNFRFNQQKFGKCKRPMLPDGFRIEPVNEQIFATFKGSVVPSNFWNNADDFVKMGAGFSVSYGETVASTAFSAFLLDGYLEIGIETIPAFRGMGLAWHCCAALIDYCIENNLEPVWACRLENTGSYRLALHLGFEPTYKIPYYQLTDLIE
ncbi:MAG: GNAT family N-acetyltransferase [Bacteroidetes bacterium]|nr:GNAT family N-acetyltransferase [Bacteroidota bacterium]